VSELELANLVGSIYDAGSGAGDWIDVGDRLTDVLGGDSTHLFVFDPDGSMTLLSRTIPDSASPYLSHFHRIDPFLAVARAEMEAGIPGAGLARIGWEMISERDYIRGEYYNDYGRGQGMRHLLGSVIPGASVALTATFRDEGPAHYERSDAARLEWIMPHFQRALQLRRQLPSPVPGGDFGLAALDALPIGVLLVDAEMHIHFANAASTEITSGLNAALRVTSIGSRLISGGGQLTARHRQDSDALRRLVASAAARKPGGAMRMRGSDGTASWAIVVSPAPTRLTAPNPQAAASGLTQGMALIMARNLEARHLPPPSLLSELFNLSKAEAEVSSLILGGAKAEDVARARHVSLDTVRSQIRTVLGKAEAQNLRDFERIAASLPLLRSADGGIRR
jgi:DNA-binding CsgD family transcriptional regulator